MGVVFGRTFGPRDPPFRQLRSLTSRFSPALCTTAARYRALQNHIFGHRFGAKFEVFSLCPAPFSPNALLVPWQAQNPSNPKGLFLASVR
jgi:hypothetical protein